MTKDHPEAVALLVELISKNAIPTCQYVDEGYPEAALPDWRVTQTATAIVAAGFVLADAASLHHPTGERITRKDLNNAFRQGVENGRFAAETLDAESRAAIAAELADPAGGEIVQLAAELACEALPATVFRAALKLAKGGEHPDDIAVDRFAVAMKAKLARKRAEGHGGWEDKADCSQAFLSFLLREHVEKGDPVDVANFCMMLHQRGERIG